MSGGRGCHSTEPLLVSSHPNSTTCRQVDDKDSKAAAEEAHANTPAADSFAEAKEDERKEAAQQVCLELVGVVSLLCVFLFMFVLFSYV